MRGTRMLCNSDGKLKFILALLTLGVGLALVVGLWYLFPRDNNQGYAPEQPIPFSHRLHAGTYKMECAYCHVGIEKSRHASVPSLNVCMNCHSVVKADSPYIQQIQAAFAAGKAIEWVRVHELPDFVYFPHKRHIKAELACETCHGNVRQMDRVAQVSSLTMGWCMDCHRGKTTPRAVLLKKYPGMKNPHGPVAPVNCSTCHD